MESGAHGEKTKNTLRLNQKFSLAVFVLTLIPFSILAIVLFSNMQNVVVAERLGEAERSLLEIRTRAEKTAELCNMTTQFFLNSPSLREFLLRANLDDPLTAEELIDFYRNDVAGFERLVNANPYLYQVRVYYDNENVPEIMPVLYHTSRMERLEWAVRGPTSGSWHFDYEDTIFPREIRQPARNLMALVTDIDDYRQGHIGTLEVAVRMNELFPDLYSPQENYLSAFATEGGLFFPSEDSSFWSQYGREVLSLADRETPPGEIRIDARVGGRNATVSHIRLKQFDGRYVIVIFKDDITSDLAGRRNIYIITATSLLLLLALVINLLVKAMLRRFYKIVSAVQMVRDGDLSVTIPGLGADELGMLGGQINQMLDRIRKLMDENVKRELLAKNSEIRALQSQINAHFIYNVLESIKMMAEVDSRYEISDAITSLGKLLRYSMRRTSDNVPLADEIGHLENYISLINLRYDYNIAISQKLPPRLLEQRLPRLTIQPIIENAVIHGIEELAVDTVIEIDACEFSDHYTLMITDYGKGIAPDALESIRKKLEGDLGEESETGGIGLKNVHDRIVMAFGPEYGISPASDIGAGRTTITIRAPYTKQVAGAGFD